MGIFNHRGVSAAVLMVSLLLAACGAKSQPGGGAGQQGPAPVGVVVVHTEPVSLTTELSGRTSAVQVSDVRPQVSGVIQARLFQEGAYVRAGQPLYQIDPATYRAGLDSALAGLAQAQAAAEAARLKAARSTKLVSEGWVAPQTNDDAQATYRQAVAAVSAQKAAVQQARIALQYTRVLAPISGRVGKSSVTPGALVTAGQAAALATIQNLDTIYVDVTQSAADLMKLKRDMASGELGAPGTAQVTLILEDGSVYPTPGQLQFSDVTVDEGTGSVSLRAVFPNPNGVLLPGLFVRARIAKGVAASGILIPQASVTRDNKGQAQVYVVGGDNKATPRILILGATIGDKWQVVSGLAPGERVIVEGLQKVRPGAAVQPQLIGAKA
ncbi:MAG: efflux transporter, family, subunit [Caulobacter sp.]|nr:efflux transporter, family, subunit [Caulobacter sp.]